MPELLSPAGNREKLEAAIRYGADAVYLAGECFGMRAFADNFTIDGLKEAVALALSLEEKYRAPVALVNCLELDKNDIRGGSL